MKTKHKVQIQKHSIISISVPEELIPLVKERAAQLDLTVSQYIRRLVNDETGGWSMTRLKLRR